MDQPGTVVDGDGPIVGPVGSPAQEPSRGPVARASTSTSTIGSDHGPAVRSVVRRLLRRGIMLGAFGLALAVGFVVAYRTNDRKVAKEARSGQQVEAEVIEVFPGTPRRVKITYTAGGQNLIVTIPLDPLAPPFAPGQKVAVVVRDADKPTLTRIIGTEKSSRVTSLPASLLFVSAISVLGLAVYEMQNALRALRHMKRGQWKSWAWRGAVDGPGRGHVNAAGYVTSPDRSEAHLLVNARGCWREGLDLLEGKAVVHVLGDPHGHVLVRHPASLRPVILRPPKNQRRERQAMERIESRAAISTSA
jgi:hypothetical protein